MEVKSLTWYDPIVAEVREAREKLWKEQDYDFEKFCKSLREKQLEHSEKICTKEKIGSENIS